MTNDQLDKLEAELSGMQPRAVPFDLLQRIEADFASDSRRESLWPDRFLLCAICSGAMAACVIIAVFIDEHRGTDAPVSETQMIANAPRFGDSPLAFARTDLVWVELLK